jgi:predicted heme/steroid binding protein
MNSTTVLISGQEQGQGQESLGSLGSKYPEITKEELQKHNKVGDLWIAIYGRVYNFSEISSKELSKHPGDLTKYGGKSASLEFAEAHPLPDVLHDVTPIGYLKMSECEIKYEAKEVVTAEVTNAVKQGLRMLVDEVFDNKIQSELLCKLLDIFVDDLRNKVLESLPKCQ